ncbi:hypothetical protein BIW11_08926, partial [Tropilaelaps mercedesae]
GYEPIDTSRGVIPPIPGVPTSGPLKKKDKDSTSSVRTNQSDMGEERREFRPVLESQTSIDLKGTKPRTKEPGDAQAIQIEVKIATIKKKSYSNIKAVKGGLVVEPSKTDEKKGLIKRVKSIKMENPFKKSDSDEKDAGGGDSGEKKPGIVDKMFKRDREGGAEESENKDKKSFSDKLTKVFHRERKDELADTDRSVIQEERARLSEKLGKMFTKEPKEPKDPFLEDGEKKPSLISKMFSKEADEEGDKKPSVINKMFSKEPKDNNLDGAEGGERKPSFMTKIFNKECKEPKDDLGGDNEQKPSLVSRVFSRDAKQDDESLDKQEGQEKKTLSEKFGDLTTKVFAKKGRNDDENDEQDGDKKTFLERYFPAEKPMIQQVVLTEEMEPDLKKRRIGRITSFQHTKEIEGEAESPAKKMIMENFDKLASKVKEVQDMMPKAISTKTEKPPGAEGDAPVDTGKEVKHDYEITTQIVFTKDPSQAVPRQVKTPSESSPLDGDDLQITPVLAESTGDTKATDKSTVFYAKIGDSEIEVKEDHYGRIQVGERKDPIYARPFKLLKRSLNDLSKSSPSLSPREEPIQYMDAGELAEEPKEEVVNHHYDELGEPGEKKTMVTELKVRGKRGSPNVIKVETQLVKGKSTSALNEPATITTVKTIEKRKPPVPPRPRPTTPTIIGKPSSPPATPTPSVLESTPLARTEGSSVEVTSIPSTRATTPSSLICETSAQSVKKIPPPRPPPPRIATITPKVTPTATTPTTVSSDSRPQTTTLKKPPKPQRPPPPKVSVTKTVTKTPFVGGNDKYSVYCQTDVGLGTDLLTRIERVVSTGGGVYEGAPYRPPRSRSASHENLQSFETSRQPKFASQTTSAPFQTQVTFYDEPAQLRSDASLNDSDLSRRISSLQSFRRSLVEQGGPPLQAAVALAIVLFWIYCPFFLLSFQSLCCLAILFLVFFK